jgi:hypothetical protein
MKKSVQRLQEVRVKRTVRMEFGYRKGAVDLIK